MVIYHKDSRFKVNGYLHMIQFMGDLHHSAINKCTPIYFQFNILKRDSCLQVSI